MKNKMRIFIIIGIVIFLGLVFMISRSSFLFALTKNPFANDFHKTLASLEKIYDTDFSKNKKDKFLIVYNKELDDSIEIRDNFFPLINYMKKDYEFIDIKEIKDIRYLEKGYTAVIFTTQDLDQIIDIGLVTSYVEKGGLVFFASTIQINYTFEQIYRKLGIYEHGDYIHTKTLKLTENVLIKATGLSITGDNVSNDSIRVGLDKKCRVYATSTNGNPMLWDVDYGMGKFMVFNGNMLEARDCRGFMAGAISILVDDFIYPVMNMKIFYIDDFPAPISDSYDEDLRKIYGRNISSVFRDIWWTDIVVAAKRNDIKYNGMIIETYENNVVGPFGKDKLYDTKNLIMYGRELINIGGELGFHGFNHQPLTMEDNGQESLEYNLWPSDKDLGASLIELNSFFKKVYPNYEITGYVPPSNILGIDGRKGLLEKIPSIKIIASVYDKDPKNISLVQEFGRSKEDNVIDLPRLTYGYEYNDHSLWAIYNGITSIGVVSHFIHLDDVLDSARSRDKSLEQLLKEYNKLTKEIYDNFSWIKSLNMSEAASNVLKFERFNFYYIKTQKKITGYCSEVQENTVFIFRTKKPISGSNNCIVNEIDNGVYSIKPIKNEFSIDLGR